LSTWLERALPRSGVYVSQATVNGDTFGSVTNVGVRPTFKTHFEQLQVETHLFNFDSQIYGQDIQLKFIRHLRDEQRFPNIDALVNQIKQDVSDAKHILSTLDG
jgi:riboflavin kinase/FMN adenylyltransferase